MGRRRAASPEARNNELIAMAYDLAEKRIREGTASAMEITHFLKLGSPKERYEIELLSQQTKLAAAKAESYQTSKNTEKLYKDALNAMRIYNGQDPQEDEDEFNE